MLATAMICVSDAMHSYLVALVRRCEVYTLSGR
jgi:hypothetical protein